MSEQTGNKEIYRIIFGQLFLVMGLAVVLLLFQGIKSGLSVITGGLAYWLPTLLFVKSVFSRARVRTAKQFLAAFMIGETVRIFLSAILFLLVLNYLPVRLLPMLAGFVGAVIAFWIASLIFLGRQQHEGAHQ